MVIYNDIKNGSAKVSQYSTTISPPSSSPSRTHRQMKQTTTTSNNGSRRHLHLNRTDDRRSEYDILDDALLLYSDSGSGTVDGSTLSASVGILHPGATAVNMRTGGFVLHNNHLQSPQTVASDELKSSHHSANRSYHSRSTLGFSSTVTEISDIRHASHTSQISPSNKGNNLDSNSSARAESQQSSIKKSRIRDMFLSITRSNDDSANSSPLSSPTTPSFRHVANQTQQQAAPQSSIIVDEFDKLHGGSRMDFLSVAVDGESVAGTILSDCHTVATQVRKNLSPAALKKSNIPGRAPFQSTANDFIGQSNHLKTKAKPETGARKNGPVSVDDMTDSDADEDENDEESTDKTLCDTESVVQVTCEDLMDDHASPGALRLTKDGLELHERKMFEAAVLNQETPKGDTFEAWKRRRDKQLWIRQQHPSKGEDSETFAKNQQDAVQINLRNTKSAVETNSTVPQANNLSKGMLKSIKNALSSNNKTKNRDRKDDDLTKFSVTALNKIVDEVNIKPIIANKPKRKQTAKFNFFKGNSTMASEKAMEILENERLAADEAKIKNMKKAIIARKEKAKVQQRRQLRPSTQQSLLETIGEREQHDPDENSEGDNEHEPNGAYSTSPLVISSLDVVKRDAKASKNVYYGGIDKQGGSLQDLSTITSVTSLTTTGILPKCVLCNKRERTHIAIPCMHFSYCEECVKNNKNLFSKKDRTVRCCSVCSKESVIFAAVSV